MQAGLEVVVSERILASEIQKLCSTVRGSGRLGMMGSASYLYRCGSHRDGADLRPSLFQVSLVDNPGASRAVLAKSPMLFAFDLDVSQ